MVDAQKIYRCVQIFLYKQQHREQPRSIRIVVAYPRPAFSTTQRTHHAPIIFYRQAQVSRGLTSCKDKESCSTEVHGSGGLDLLKPACDPASGSPRNLARSPLLVGPHRNKTDPKKPPPSRVLDSRGQGFSTLLAPQRSGCSLLSPNLVLTRPKSRACHGTLARAAAPYQAFHDIDISSDMNSARCLSRATTSRRTPNLSSEAAHLVNTIIDQPNRRLSTYQSNRLNREESQLAASLEGESSPTLAGKTLRY